MMFGVLWLLAMVSILAGNVLSYKDGRDSRTGRSGWLSNVLSGVGFALALLAGQAMGK